jgi:dipeptidyl aminopeptidase/acylaminoacyl peptidase
MHRGLSARAALLVASTLGAVGAIVAGPPGRAQAPRPMTVLDLAELPRVLDPQLSPDGTSVVYVLNQADWRANRPIGQIWRQDGAGEPVQLTREAAGASTPRWSPDGGSLLFLSRGENGTQVFLLPVAGGDARPLTRHATSVSAPAWAPDGRFVYFLAPDPPTADERTRERLRDDVYAFDGNGKARHLWRIDVASGEERQISDGTLSVLTFRLSRDGRRVALHRAPTSRPADSHKSEVWLMDADGANARALTANLVEEADAELSPDGTRVLFLAEANERFEPYFSASLFVVPASGGTPRRLETGTPAVERATWAPDGGSILAVVNQGVSSKIVRIRETGGRVESSDLTRGEHSVQFWSVGAGGRMVFLVDEPTRPGDVWTIEPGGAPRRVTRVYDQLASTFHLPRQERVTWKGADGVAIEGVLFHPLGREPGQRHPLIVQLHGGPSESDKFGWGPGVIVNYVPVLSGLGYFVLRPNYRGSAGYGDAFLRDVVGGYFRNMHLDVLAGVDALVARGLVDSDRVGVMGWSAGGHLTNKLVTVTDRFKAASSTAGAANWISMFAQTDTRAHRALWFGGTPWQSNAPLDAFLDHSPIRDAARVRTPTLLFVGAEDGRVPLAQSIEMYRALEANGVESVLYVAPREGHQWGELRHQVFKANTELAWFERLVRGRAYTPVAAPDPAPTASRP